MRLLFVFAFGLAILSHPNLACGQDSSTYLKTIKAVGKEGKGNAEAAKAWKGLVALGSDALLDTLAAMDDASPVALNWLHSAVDAIAQTATASGKRLPVDKLEAFLNDHKHNGKARKLAFDWLTRTDKSAPDRLLPGMVDDPGVELRRDAVAVLITSALEKVEKDKAGATAAFQKILLHARDEDQVKKTADQLKKLGVDVNLTKQFGFLTQWQLVGPFDNVKGVGFSTPYPPEKGFQPDASYESKDKEKVTWKAHTTELPMGLVDINKIYGNLKGAIVYAYTAVDSPAEQPVDLRAGSFNALRMYLNGKEVYFREEYHHGMTMDQHIAKGLLRKGKNEILIKVCQNEQKDSWATNWGFQFRVCDSLGTPVNLTVIDPKK